jgi:hypothetical protein
MLRAQGHTGGEHWSRSNVTRRCDVEACWRLKRRIAPATPHVERHLPRPNRFAISSGLSVSIPLTARPLARSLNHCLLRVILRKSPRARSRNAWRRRLAR